MKCEERSQILDLECILQCAVLKSEYDITFVDVAFLDFRVGLFKTEMFIFQDLGGAFLWSRYAFKDYDRIF